MTKRTIITKHIPQRTCVACRQVKDKGQLIHLVRLPSGSIEVNTDGRKAGRGAYLCPAPQCWQGGLIGGRLEHALRTGLSRENREQLIEFGKNLAGS